MLGFVYTSQGGAVRKEKTVDITTGWLQKKIAKGNLKKII